MDDDLDDDRPRSRRRRRREYEDDDFDDPSDRRETIADGLLMAQRVSSQGVGQAMSQSKDMMTIMLMTNQENQKMAREDAIRREDARAKEEMENRRRDQERKDTEDKRRYDEERKREDDRIRREEDRRREDMAKAEERREADRKHERDLAEARAASDRKFQTIMAAIPAIIPLAANLFKPAQPREQDALTMMIAKSFLEDKRERDPNAAVAVIVEATKLGSQLQTEQMRQAMTMQGELNKVLLTKALENVNDGGGGKNMIETITELVSGAATLAEKLIPAKPAPNPYQQQAVQRIQHQPQQQQPQQRPASQSAPTAASQAAEQGQQPAPENKPGEPAQLTPEQEQAAAQALTDAVNADPTYGTLRALYGIQNRFYENQAQYQRMIEYSVQCMPLDLRVAILDNNEARVMELVVPTIQRHAELFGWANSMEVITWLREFVPQLAPTIEGMHGPAAQQREQYIAVLAQGQAQLQNEPEQVAQPEQPAQVPQEGAPVGEQALAAQEAIVVDEQLQQPETTAEIIQGPGSIQEATATPVQPIEQVPVDPPAVSGSHLEPEV